jgi:hypothetical protein
MQPDTGTTIRAFDAQNGESVIDSKNRVIRFETGARREMAAYGALYEPPADQYECAKLKHEFWRLRTTQGETLFERQKKSFEEGNPGVLGTGGGGAMCEMAHTREQVNAVMQKLKDEVLRSREGLAKAERELDEVTPSHVKARRAEVAARQAQADDAKADLDQYTL